MKKQDWLWLGVLALAGAWVWLRDTQWRGALDDSLPILAALPLFAWLWAPWQFRAEPWRLDARWLGVACGLLPLGVALDRGLILALAWIALAWSWLAARVVPPPRGRAAKLSVLLLLAFPWLVTDFESVAWWFRLSGAQAAAAVSEFCGFWIVREGTQIWANGFAVNVEPACSGMHGLQALLVAGATLACWHLRDSRWFWWNLPVIVLAAWLANLVRIVSALWAGAWLDPVSAARWVDPLHLVAGTVAIAVAFVGCHLLFAWQAGLSALSGRELRRRVRAWPWLEMALIAYGAWCARGLVANWIWTPYDRYGWLAFSLWILPAVIGGSGAGRTSTRADNALLAAGIALLLGGALMDVNALYHLAIATLIASAARADARWLWLAGAVTWMPAFGWLGSRWGVAPETFAICRVAGALVAAGIGLGTWRSGRAVVLSTEEARRGARA